ncbi:MAG TPA: tetratricopeptide repeat protein [Gallionella sp.]|jgi:predicted negative regulator of RcsB-dependent stress response|nr:tetratricopeptide repeat protein [Gallionella sp.]
MAALDLQEQEQIDALKAWWKENGNQLLGALLVVMVAIGGWRGWQYYQHQQSNEAATLYAEFTRQLDSGDVKRVNDFAGIVMGQNAGSGYAPRAALLAAQVNEQVGEQARAKTQLHWVIDHAEEAGLKDVARLRLVAVLLDEKKYDDTQQLLEAKHPISFDGLYADLKGDVLSAQGKNTEAKSAYKLAYEKTDAGSAYRDLIEMKMDAIGGEK